MTTINREISATEFVASPALAADMQAVLVDLLELQNRAKQAHWNVVGPQFRAIHLQLDEIVDMVRENADSVAERMRALDAVPDGRTSTIRHDTTLAPLPAGEIGDEARHCHDRSAKSWAPSTQFDPCTTTSMSWTRTAPTYFTLSSKGWKSSAGW